MKYESDTQKGWYAKRIIITSKRLTEQKKSSVTCKSILRRVVVSNQF